MSEESLLTTAYQFIQIGEIQTAERLLTGLIRKEPRSEAAWLLLAACKRLPEEKEKCLEFVAEINPQNGPALQALGELISGRDADALILRAFGRLAGSGRRAGGNGGADNTVTGYA